MVFRIARLPSGGWSLETASGDVGGIFASKHAALSYACTEAENCPAESVLIELAERRRQSTVAGRAAAQAPLATGT